MGIRLMAVVLTACGTLINSSPLVAQDNFGLLSRAGQRAYHACLYAHWIDDYCHFHAWGPFPQALRDCVIANGGCKCVTANGGYWGPDIDDACRIVYQPRGR